MLRNVVQRLIVIEKYVFKIHSKNKIIHDYFKTKLNEPYCNVSQMVREYT